MRPYQMRDRHGRFPEPSIFLCALTTRNIHTRQLGKARTQGADEVVKIDQMHILQHLHRVGWGDEDVVAQRLHLAAIAPAEADGRQAHLFRRRQRVQDVRRVAAAAEQGAPDS